MADHDGAGQDAEAVAGDKVDDAATRRGAPDADTVSERRPGSIARGKLAPSVARPVPRLRLGFVVALLLVMAGGVTTLLVRGRGGGGGGGAPAARSSWWAEVGSHCTPLEVELAIKRAALDDGQRATCLAVAGRIADARALLLRMPDRTQRNAAVATMFSIAHPIADAGDDKSAGPIMGLVVELWPENYMAMFHAGMAEFALGHDVEAKLYLDRFLGMYHAGDVWQQRAETALAAIAAHAPLDHREAHFRE